tara:strand:+ start:9323 stop:9964 length:642 start_codon:yes stop_codon:yes gene_type:complete
MRTADWRKIWAGGLFGASAVFLASILSAVMAGGPVMAQDQTQQAGPTPQPAQVAQVSPASIAFRTLDQDRLLRESRLGMQILATIRDAERALEEENATIAAQLAAEEQDLTQLRARLTPEEFRTRAEAFDARVEAVRAERNQRALELARQNEAEAQRFFNAALPILERLLIEQGIVAVMRPDAMILGPDWLDITPLAIERMDTAYPHQRPVEP